MAWSEVVANLCSKKTRKEGKKEIKERNAIGIFFEA